jgi:hypothetical protein
MLRIPPNSLDNDIFVDIRPATRGKVHDCSLHSKSMLDVALAELLVTAGMATYFHAVIDRSAHGRTEEG